MLVGGGRKNGVSRFKHQDVGLEFFIVLWESVKQ
jgi:hypothetical protein